VFYLSKRCPVNPGFVERFDNRAVFQHSALVNALYCLSSGHPMPPDLTPPIELTVNGQLRRLRVNPDTPVLMVLRHDLNLLGTRIGCTEGACGACTVLLDGKAVQSCNLPVWSIAGRAITTIEALSVAGPSLDPAPGGVTLPGGVSLPGGAGGVPGPVQQAFLDEQAAQCGYCINGIMMTVTAMLALQPPATRADIIAALDERHLCRCGAHPRILRAVDRAIRQTPRPSGPAGQTVGQMPGSA
jgi:aerobic-type carbon monoxide dehydrogenase small subunit (CoxS/CutS family)